MDADTDIIDDSLLLGYKKTTSELLGPDKIALSVSTCKQYLEDPAKFYFRKVEKKKEPSSIALAIGSSGHDALEAFYNNYSKGEARIQIALDKFASSLESRWDKVDEKMIRENPDDPMNPRNKVKREITQEEILWYAHDTLKDVLFMLHKSSDSSYSFLKAQSGEMLGVEKTIGQLAQAAGNPTAEMNLFDPRIGYMKKMPVAVIAGVPFHGFVDAVGQWDDGSKVIIDHKFVGSAVTYYPPYWADKKGLDIYKFDWTMYDPSYPPESDPQLDVYAHTSGIARAGFQFITKKPQYVPKSGVLHPNWKDALSLSQKDIDKGVIPTVLGRNKAGDLYYIGTYRPGTSKRYQIHKTGAKAERWVRAAAEGITESLLLYKKGVDPFIAFPGGDPKKIARKACPFCHFADVCDGEREPNDKSEEEYIEQVKMREQLCLETPEIMERRELWGNMTPKVSII